MQIYNGDFNEVLKNRNFKKQNTKNKNAKNTLKEIAQTLPGAFIAVAFLVSVGMLFTEFDKPEDMVSPETTTNREIVFQNVKDLNENGKIEKYELEYLVNGR